MPNLVDTNQNVGENTVGSSQIIDGSIANADINAAAAIALTKLAGDTTTALGIGTVELGHATDTTLARGAAGRLTVEGVNVVTISSTDTLTNKTLTSPTLTTPSIGVATGTSFNSITGLSSTTPVIDGIAAVGTDTTAARGDHVHPTDTSRAATSETLAQFAATTSAQLAGVISDETGTGALVFATSPTLTTPSIGVATATSLATTSIQVGVTAAGEIDTSSGNLTIDSAGGTVTVDDNLTVTGNLTVSGTTTSVNTETVTIDDNIIVLNNNATGEPSENAGIEIERGSSTNVAIRWNETNDQWELTNDGTTYGNVITTADSGTVTSTMIADGTIVNADINASAGIALSKLANITAGQVLLGDASNVPTATALSGDVTVNSSGVTAIGSGVIVNEDISSSAAIEIGKIADVTIDTKTSNYTLVLTDKNKFIEMNLSGTNTVSVPTNASVAFPIGSQIHITQYGAGKTQIVAVTSATTTIRSTPGAYLRAQYSSATLVKRATDEWYLVGDLSAT